jgi:hypothetical protein
VGDLRRAASETQRLRALPAGSRCPHSPSHPPPSGPRARCHTSGQQPLCDSWLVWRPQTPPTCPAWQRCRCWWCRAARTQRSHPQQGGPWRQHSGRRAFPCQRSRLRGHTRVSSNSRLFYLPSWVTHKLLTPAAAVELVELADCGHLPMEERPTEVVDAVARFVAAHCLGAPSASNAGPDPSAREAGEAAVAGSLVSAENK